MSPKGFWSYARGDDDHLGGVLSALRKQIEGEVSMLLGHDVGIFQDTRDLNTGDRWAEALRDGVTKAAFLIPVLTPRFFNRDWCREEVLTFLQIAKDKGLEPRIFPILFVEWDEEDGCEVREALAPFQFKDLSHWRLEPDPTQKSKLIYEFAKDVKARLKLPQVTRPVVKSALDTIVMRSEVLEPPKGKAPDGPKYKTYVVDPMPGRGDFFKIGHAIKAAEPGSKIVVREGTYREALRLSKPLEIVGEGDRERILVVTATGNALHCDAPMARISGMRFRCEAGPLDNGIWITDGAVELEDCVIECLLGSCAAIGGAGSNPSIRRCIMRLSAKNGLQVYGGAQPVVEDCEIFGNASSGLAVGGLGTQITLRRCLVRDSGDDGFFFYNGASGLMERCEAVSNTSTGVVIMTEAQLSLRDCNLRDNRRSGVSVHEAGWGRLQGCEITGNYGVGVFISGTGASEVTGCTINRNALEAVWIKDTAGSGVFRGNDLRGNGLGAWDIAEGTVVTRADNME